MRHVGWFSVVLLALSCAVDNSNLNVDAGGPGTGGAAGVTGSGGSAGATGTGGAAGDGCPRCAPTGGTGGGATGGASAGASGTGGAVTGTAGASGGQSGAGGATGTGGKATGGTTGTGGKGSGGATGTGGQGGGAKCDTLANQYSTELTAAKSCSLGAANQCQQLVDSSRPCPGCKTYVNDVTNLNKIASDWAAAGCASMVYLCPLIACVVPGPATCQAVVNTGGGGPGPSGTTAMCNSAPTPVGTN